MVQTGPKNTAEFMAKQFLGHDLLPSRLEESSVNQTILLEFRVRKNQVCHIGVSKKSILQKKYCWKS